ncbi:MAG: Amuc_1100 family pilus-like protein [Kiritimatiellae bacterium]|nr:Amuc_1100 family pilus-like protein [Kiritimatiellia bacterium]
MKRNKIILTVSLAITVIICAFVGWLLVTTALEKKAAYDQRNSAFEGLTRIYNAKVFPDNGNIARTKENQAELEGWLTSVSNLLHKGDLPHEELTPAAFKQRLQSAVRKLSAEPGMKRGKIVLPNFHFGFDQYLGESDSLPISAHVPRLNAQLCIIERICNELHAAKVHSIESITRENFESADAQVQARPESQGGRRRRSPSGPSESEEAAVEESASEYFEKQRFTFEFIASQTSFVEALNKLASTEMFIVVAETSFVKTGDPLQRLIGGGGSKTESENVEKKDPATMTHVERMITNPDIDPPIKVTLVIDVYSFKGV